MPFLRFPKDYFDEEVREGFYVEPLMKQAWAAELEVLERVRSICIKHGIRFFADYGTMLGAVRHKGFIPWDDDLDITMFREDLMKFIRVAKAELPESYVIANCHDMGNREQLIVRVVNTGFIRLEEDFREEYHGFPFAAGLDIWPLDYIPDDPKEFETMKNLLTIGREAMVSYHEPQSYTDEMRDQYTTTLEQIFNIHFDRSGDMVQQTTEILDAICAMYTREESSRCAIAYRLTFQEEEQVIHPLEWYDSAIEQPFEVTSIPVPIGYHEYLTQEYGDYMEPVCAARHDYPFYDSQLKVLKNWLAPQGLTVKDVGVLDRSNESTGVSL